jgi:acetolactate synthase-1/2/3 large subunit
MTVSDYIADELVRRNILDVFLLSGGGMMYLLDALGRKKDIRIHCHHHEQDAGIAAEGYARIKGSPGICFVTGGPGGLNATEAIAECWVDSVPVIFIGGQSPLAQTTRGSGIKGLRQYGAAEIDILPIVQSITKKAYFVTDAEKIPKIMDEAFYLATHGRPGPVFLNIPLDIQNALISDAISASLVKSVPQWVAMPQITWVMRQWMEAVRPVILAGQGVRIAGASAINDLLQLAERIQTPIITTQAGKDLLPYTHPLFVGHVGIKGDRAGNYAIQKADFILCIGTSLHVFTTGYDYREFAPFATIVYIELDEALGQRQKETISHAIQVSCGVSEFLKNALILCPSNTIPPSWNERLLLTIKPKYDIVLETREHRDSFVNIYDAVQMIQTISDEGDIVVSDAGSAFYVVGQAWKLKEGQRYISSNGLGSMGWAIPAAHGAWIASGRRVWCFTGDGSLMTALQEIATIPNDANITIIVLDNGGYLSIRNTQDHYFAGRYTGTGEDNGVHIPDIKKVAELYGWGYQCITDTASIKSIVNTPTILHIRCMPKQGITPTVLSGTDNNGSFLPGELDRMFPFTKEDE